MIRKTYNSFDEIDKDLKILRLKKEIAVWTAKNNYKELQNNLSPKNFLGGLFRGFTKGKKSSYWLSTVGSIAIGYIAKRILKR